MITNPNATKKDIEKDKKKMKEAKQETIKHTPKQRIKK